MQTMLTFAEHDFSVLRRRVAECERAGVTAVGVGDSPNYLDPYVALASIAESTSSIRIGPMVTNLVTRSPRDVAGAMRSIDKLAGAGRAFVGVGAGDSAIAGSGAKPRGVEGFRQGIRETAMHWPASSDSKWRIAVAANGPRTLRMAMAQADIVISGAGIDQPSLDRLFGMADDVKQELGRVAQIWVVVRVSFGADSYSATQELRPLLASGANHVFGSSHELARLDAKTAEAVRELRARYDYSTHGQRDNNPNADLVDELGLRQFLASKFAIAGEQSEVIRRLRQLSERGIAGVVIPAVGLDVDRLVDNFADCVKSVV